MKIHCARHATISFEMDALRMLVDPMLGEATTAPAVSNTPNGKPNSLVDLPFGEDGLADLFEHTDAVLVTHTHNDHWDGRAQELIPKDTLVLCQPEEVINHCLLTRAELSEALDEQGLAGRVEIPADGETLETLA